MERGRIIDANNANEQGPFSPERTGELPAKDVAELAFSGDFTKDELIGKFLTKGGLVAYLGTSRAQEIERRIAQGMSARLVYEGMAYQISKEIGLWHQSCPESQGYFGMRWFSRIRPACFNDIGEGLIYCGDPSLSREKEMEAR